MLTVAQARSTMLCIPPPVILLLSLSNNKLVGRGVTNTLTAAQACLMMLCITPIILLLLLSNNTLS